MDIAIFLPGFLFFHAGNGIAAGWKRSIRSDGQPLDDPAGRVGRADTVRRQRIVILRTHKALTLLRLRETRFILADARAYHVWEGNRGLYVHISWRSCFMLAKGAGMRGTMPAYAIIAGKLSGATGGLCRRAVSTGSVYAPYATISSPHRPQVMLQWLYELSIAFNHLQP